uniref:BEN domain-containing protein n=1 Tax=Bactrocera dorsalis TaxID=27457 RepID=A0A034VH12_BACDO
MTEPYILHDLKPVNVTEDSANNFSEEAEQTLVFLQHWEQGSDDADQTIVQNSPLKCFSDELEQSTEIRNVNSNPPPTYGEKNEKCYDLHILGLNGTAVLQQEYNKIDWDTASHVTRALSRMVFDHETLATHTCSLLSIPYLTSRKPQLNPLVVDDIIYCVKNVFKCSEREIRKAIRRLCIEERVYVNRRRKKEYLKNGRAQVDNGRSQV